MQVGRLYTIILRFWLLTGGLLGMTSCYYSSKRRQLVRSTLLRIYSGLMMLCTLAAFYFYFSYGMKYFIPSDFHHSELLNTMCIINMCLHFVLVVNQIRLRLTNEREIIELFNRLMELCHLWGLRRSFSSICKYFILVKAFAYVHQIIGPVVGLLIVVERRQITFMDIFSNVYFIYNFNTKHSYMLVYLLMLLQLAETMKMSVSQGQINFWTKWRRQAKLLQMTQRIHQIFAFEILIALITHFFFNTCTFYMAYSLIGDGEFWNAKVQLSIFAFLINNVDILLIELVCEHVLAREKVLFDQLKYLDENVEMNRRECEIAQLIYATLNSKGPPKHVLGMFRMDKCCAFNIMSSSLIFAIISMQVGYIHQQNKQ